jgi:hypothetical protein
MFARPANGFGRGDNVIAAEFRRNEMGAQRTMAGCALQGCEDLPVAWLRQADRAMQKGEKCAAIMTCPKLETVSWRRRSP